MSSPTIFDLSAKSGDGSEFDFSDHRGKVLLIVNTASKCGFAPQYDGLEALHRRYADEGLVVVAFPCDQFAHQEPGDDAEIATACRLRHSVTFPVMAKVDVNGAAAHPVFAFLRRKAPGLLGDGIKWNFTKFLVSRDGQAVRRFAPATEPAAMERYIEGELAR